MFYFEVEYDEFDNTVKERGLVSSVGSYEVAMDKLINEYGRENILSLTMKPVIGTSEGILVFSDDAEFDPDTDVLIV